MVYDGLKNVYRIMREDYVRENLDCDEIIDIVPANLGFFRDMMRVFYIKDGEKKITEMEFPKKELKKLRKRL